MTGGTRCAWQDILISDDEAVLVGAIERGSGPPRLIHACTGCVAVHDLLPLVEHPDDSDGGPRHRSGHAVLIPATATPGRS